MSLLTEKQIVELVEMASVPIYLHDKICEWNEKQTTQQIEPDWSKASDDAVSAVVHVTWVNKLGTWLGSNPVVIFERPATVITPHPHAALIAKFAEVAARRVDPWVEFEVRCEVKGWTRCGEFNGFHPDFEYRHIGDDK